MNKTTILISEKANKALDLYVALERLKNPKLNKRKVVEHIILNDRKIKQIIKNHGV